MIIKGNFLDITRREVYPAEIIVEGGKIVSIIKQPPSPSPTLPGGKGHQPHSISLKQDANNNTDTPKSGPAQHREAPPPEGFGEASFILPGFIDAHVHIESSMLIPSEFARLAVVHGTVATVSDPHEIANVCGIAGVEFMIKNGNTVPFKFYFGAPSCVPATTFETAGATLNSKDVEALLQRDEIKYLTEMMNFPGVLNGDEEVLKKIATAQKVHKPVDGHAPGLRGDAAKKYIDAGISTDHECFTKEEALDKLQHGMKIIIREGSAAKNFNALVDLLHDYPEQIMFCSDDKHPDSLVEGHINQLCPRAVAKGIDVFSVLRAACINPVLHYKLDVGLLKEGDAADFIVVKDLENFEVLQTYINGELVAEGGKSKIPSSLAGHGAKAINNFNCTKKTIEDFEVSFATHHPPFTVIEALDGQLITNKIIAEPKVMEGKIVSDVEHDILKIVVVNRYNDVVIAKAFIKNFGFTHGAIASSVAHDSHNIVAVGVDDESICRAVNLIIENQGGISLTPGPSPFGEENHTQPLIINETAFDKRVELILPLPVAGLMSNEDGYKIAEEYATMDKRAKELGSTLSAPYMTLSFMALLVIPHLKLSDKGLFDGDEFRLV